MGFDSFGLEEALLQGTKDLGYKDPTPIQEQAIPAVLSGRDVIGLAQTGTGKTAAFLLPILNRLLRSPGPVTRCLVLAPTRELVQQIETVCVGLTYRTSLSMANVIGGADMSDQTRALKAGADIVIATPGRLLDHFYYGYPKTDKLEFLVLDEADRMLDMGFMPDIEKIVRRLPEKRQTLLFSATLPPAIEKLAKTILVDPVMIEIGNRRRPAESVSQELFECDHRRKPWLLVDLLKQRKMESVLVFTATKLGANRLWSQLSREGVKCAVIHGDREQAERFAALESFRQGATPVLVATDIAARGIDVSGISHVVNYDVPRSAEDFIHRIGRTGRAGETGHAITLCAADEKYKLALIEKTLKIKIQYGDPATRLERGAETGRREANPRAREAAEHESDEAPRARRGGRDDSRPRGETRRETESRPSSPTRSHSPRHDDGESRRPARRTEIGSEDRPRRPRDDDDRSRTRRDDEARPEAPRHEESRTARHDRDRDRPRRGDDTERGAREPDASRESSGRGRSKGSPRPDPRRADRHDDERRPRDAAPRRGADAGPGPDRAERRPSKDSQGDDRGGARRGERDSRRAPPPRAHDDEAPVHRQTDRGEQRGRDHRRDEEFDRPPRRDAPSDARRAAARNADGKHDRPRERERDDSRARSSEASERSTRGAGDRSSERGGRHPHSGRSRSESAHPGRSDRGAQPDGRSRRDDSRRSDSRRSDSRRDDSRRSDPRRDDSRRRSPHDGAPRDRDHGRNERGRQDRGGRDHGRREGGPGGRHVDPRVQPRGDGSKKFEDDPRFEWE